MTTRKAAEKAVEKAVVENEDTSKTEPSLQNLETRDYHNSARVSGKTYEIGDCVYITNPVDNSKPSIIQIHQIWTEKKTRVRGIVGCCFLRPENTYHVPTRRFYPNEVFRNRDLRDYLFSDVQGKCCVLFIKDYVKGKPKGFKDEDVYVCESRYIETSRTMHPIKNWKSVLPPAVLAKETYPPVLEGEPRKIFKSVPSIFSAGDVPEDQSKQTTTIKLPQPPDPVDESKSKPTIKLTHPIPPENIIRLKGQSSSDEPTSKRSSTSESHQQSKRLKLSGPTSPASSDKEAEEVVKTKRDRRGEKGEKETGISIRWTLAETLCLVRAVQKFGVHDWPNVLEECGEILKKSNHYTVPKVRERYRLLVKNMPDNSVTEDDILVAIDEKVEESGLTMWLVERRKRQLGLTDLDSTSTPPSGADPALSLQFPKLPALKLPIQPLSPPPPPLPQQQQQLQPQQPAKPEEEPNMESYGVFTKDQVPPTYIDESVLSKDFVNMYVHTPQGRIMWFSRPPLDIISQPGPSHSAEYVRFKQQQAELEDENEPEPELISNPQQSKYALRLREVARNNWYLLMNALLQGGQQPTNEDEIMVTD